MRLHFVSQQLVALQCKYDTRTEFISLHLYSMIMSLLKKASYYAIRSTFYVLIKHIFAYEQFGSLIIKD